LKALAKLVAIARIGIIREDTVRIYRCTPDTGGSIKLVQFGPFGSRTKSSKAITRKQFVFFCTHGGRSNCDWLAVLTVINVSMANACGCGCIIVEPASIPFVRDFVIKGSTMFC
jgi:hypothetical protein